MLSMITCYINVIFINIKNIRNSNIYLYCIRIVLFITREKYRKYLWKKSQVCHGILAILKSLRHHTCDFYLRFFVCTCDFCHTCDISCKTILAIFFASMLHEIASMEGQRDRLRTISQVFQDKNRKYANTMQRQIASMLRGNRKYANSKSQVFQEQIASIPKANRKYSKSKSQVFQVKIASMSRYVFDIFASMLT